MCLLVDESGLILIEDHVVDGRTAPQPVPEPRLPLLPPKRM